MLEANGRFAQAIIAVERAQNLNSPARRVIRVWEHSTVSGFPAVHDTSVWLAPFAPCQARCLCARLCSLHDQVSPLPTDGSGETIVP